MPSLSRHPQQNVGDRDPFGFVPPFTLKEGLSRTLELTLSSSFSLGKAQASLAFHSLVRRFEFVHPREDAIEFVSE